MTLLKIGRDIVDDNLEALENFPLTHILEKIPIAFVFLSFTELSWYRNSVASVSNSLDFVDLH